MHRIKVRKLCITQSYLESQRVKYNVLVKEDLVIFFNACLFLCFDVITWRKNCLLFVVRARMPLKF